MKLYWSIAQGDSLPKLKLYVTDAAGLVEPLTSAIEVAVYMVHVSSGRRITLDAAISDAIAGEITVTWAASHTAQPGRYRLWIVLTFAGGEMTVPTCPDGADAIYGEICPR